jgi:hypothetical protein
MPRNISFQPLRVLIDGHDSEGSLVLWGGQLAAVIVRLDGEHHDPEHKGLWHLEAGFGKCDIRVAPPVLLHPCSRRSKRPEPGLDKS